MGWPESAYDNIQQAYIAQLTDIQQTYMFLVWNSTRVSTLHILKQSLKFLTLFLNCTSSMLKWIFSPIRLKSFVGMEVFCDSCPICLGWLLIADDRISANTLPRHAKLDIFFLCQICSSFWGLGLRGLNRCRYCNRINSAVSWQQICVRALEFHCKLIDKKKLI